MVALAAVVALTGCGLKTGSVFVANVEPGSIKPIPSLKGVTLTVGSKDFTEQLVLGYITAIAVRAAGAEVFDRINIKGTDGFRQALLGGGVDIGYEYTGTGWISFLKQTKPIPNERQQYEAVRDADAKNNMTWLPPAPLNNTYAYAMNDKLAKELKITKLSQLSDLVKKDPNKYTFCVESEFANRDDGQVAATKTYGFKPAPSKFKNLDTGLIYTQTAKGDCDFGEVFTTDGRIKPLKLTVLDDDKKAFPLYNAAVNIRTPIYKQHPQLAELFAPISAKLTNESITDLNTKVSEQGQDPSKVALDWMIKEGFVKSPEASAQK